MELYSPCSVCNEKPLEDFVQGSDTWLMLLMTDC